MFLSSRRIRSVLAASVISAGLCFASSPAMADIGGATTAALNPGAAVSLNHQPIPPGVLGLGDQVSLNPQPIPPGVLGLGDQVSLNPQPIPPGVLGLGDQFSLNP